MFEELAIGKSAKLAKKFTPVHPDPKIGKKHGVSLMLYGKHSSEYQNAIAATIRARQDGEMTLDEGIEQAAKLIVACCAGWANTKAESEIKYDPEKLLEILVSSDYKWMRLQADRFIQQDDNYF